MKSFIKNENFNLGYVPCLDGIRAIAILGVMSAHAQVPYCNGGGGIGVGIFFVLSGFLITSILAQEWRKYGSISLNMFYLRRILRLFPALILLLLTYLAYSFMTMPIIKWKSPILDASIVAFYAANWVRAFELKGLGLLEHTWSLSIEEQFYLLWPLILVTMLKFIRSRFIIVGVSLLAVFGSYLLRTAMFINGATILRLYDGLDTRADSLLTGCLMSLILYSRLLPLNTNRFISFLRSSSLLGLIGLIVLFVLCEPFGKQYHFLWPHIYFLISVFSGLMIFGLILAPIPLMKTILERPFFVITGKISYGLYLWHYPIYCTLKDFNLSWPVVLIIGTPLSYAAAGLSHHFIEQPFLRLKNLFAHSKTNEIMPCTQYECACKTEVQDPSTL